MTIIVSFQRRVLDSMGAPELTLNGTIPVVITCARRTTVRGFRLLLWRHIRRFVKVREDEDELAVLTRLPVRMAGTVIANGGGLSQFLDGTVPVFR